MKNHVKIVLTVLLGFHETTAWWPIHSTTFFSVKNVGPEFGQTGWTNTPNNIVSKLPADADSPVGSYQLGDVPWVLSELQVVHTSQTNTSLQCRHGLVPSGQR